MARRELIQYIDDLDGTALNEDDLRVVRFSFEGKNYLMDLSTENADKFEQLLQPYIERATIDSDAYAAAPRRRSSNPNSAHSRERNRKIREWARKNGYDVAARGALRKDIIEKYEHNA